MARAPRKPAAAPGRRALLVMGMHRSGTSALARVLSLRGAELPAHLMSANRGNTSGYWEPAPIVAFNDEVLGYFGSAWDDPFAAFQLPEPSLFPRKFQTRAQALIDQEYADSGLFILKDPRLCLLGKFWASMLAARDVQVCPVLLARPFGEVAASLQTRDQSLQEASVLLHVAYAVESALAWGGEGASVLRYDQLLADWRGSSDRIALEQQLQWPRAGAFLDAEVAQFLAPGISRARSLQLSPRVQAWTEAVWAWYAARTEGKPAKLAPLQAVRVELAEAAATWSPLLSARREKIQQSESALIEAQDQVEQSRSLLEQTQAARAEDRVAHDQLQAAHERTARERDELMAQRDRLQVLLDRQRGEGSERSQAYAELLIERDALLAKYQASRREGELARSQADTSLAERDRLLELYRQTQSELEHAQSAFSDAKREADGLRASVLQFAEDLASLQVERDRALSAYEGANSALHSTELAFQRLAAEADSLRSQRAAQAESIANLHTRLESQLAEVMATRDLVDIANDKVKSVEDEREGLRALAAQRELELVRLRELAAKLESQQLRQANEAQALQREIQVTRSELRRAQDGLEQIRASRSWRITAPLRSVANAGRNILQVSRNGLHRPRRLLALEAPKMREIGEGPATEAGQDRNGEPAWTRRKHPGLRAFLQAEFGEADAADFLQRIDRYRLPVATEAVHSAASVPCSNEDAQAWAAALARRAAQLPDAGDAAPDVSIVVTAFNQLPFTLACVDALLAQRSRYRFEILIGDDASTDATSTAFAEPIAHLLYLRHPRNLGFLRNCNATAALARGRHLVMLNNDALVLPGWLDELVDVLEHNPSVGLVGSKLVYPDGRLQECGGIVWRDGSAWNFGRLEDPRKPEHNYLRGADFVSGASIALPTALWRRLGGFDEHFAPAYAEDADLAFRVRAAGYYTLVQPLSQAIHFEGVTAGTDLAQGMKAHQVVNLRKLHERWESVLAGHRENAQAPELEKERDVFKRLLFVDHCTLTPNEDAGSQVAFEIMKGLRRFGYKVTFIPEDNFAHMGEDTRVLQRLGVETIYHPAYSRMEQFLAARDDSFDAILIHRFTVGDRHLPALRARYPGAKLLFLVCDLHYLRELREAELNGDPAAIARAQKTRQRELAVAAACDAVMVYSDAERAMLATDLPNANLVLFPLVQDPVPRPAPLQERDGVCFVGGYRHPPNADAVLWFADQVWPLVHARCPQATLYVAGSHMTEAVKVLGRRPGIEITGFVPDMEGFLSRRRVNVAPLRFGAGVKGKVAASLANGLPTVGTSIAAEGMLLTPGRDVLVADNPAEFADKVVELLTQDARWREVSEAGLHYASTVTSRASASERLAAMLSGLGLPSQA